MSTLTSLTLNKFNRKGRVAVPVSPEEFWDDTNKRYKSGILKIALSSLTPTGIGEAGVPIVVVRPCVYDPAHHTEYRRTDGTIALASTYNHALAINYGVPAHRLSSTATVSIPRSTSKSSCRKTPTSLARSR